MLNKLIIGRDVTPHMMAFGVAFGTLVALLPTFGFSAIVAVALMPFLPVMNKASVFLGLAFWNPFVQVPIYGLSLELGSVLYTGTKVTMYHFELLNQIATYTLRFLLGHLAITLLITVATYGLVFFFRKFTFRQQNTELIFS